MSEKELEEREEFGNDSGYGCTVAKMCSGIDFLFPSPSLPLSLIQSFSLFDWWFPKELARQAHDFDPN